MSHLAADGRRLLENASLGDQHLLELAPGPTPATSPGLAVDLRVGVDGVTVVEWRRGERWRKLRLGQA